MNPETAQSSVDARSVVRPHRPRGLPPEAITMRMLGLDYVHMHTLDGSDLDITPFGVPHWKCLQPENWYDREWFQTHRQRLRGTSTVYRLKTKEVDGRRLDLVVKFSRVGEEVPLDRSTFTKFSEAEFNSPYEEFSLVMEMRNRPSPHRVRTHHPLAIFTPAERLKPWQTGRKESRIMRKSMKYRDIELDMCRQYILVYEWVKGISAVDAFENLYTDENERRRELEALTLRVGEELRYKGFRVIDHKPTHFIVRPRGNDVLRDRSGQPCYALVDFELLQRTHDHEREVQAARRLEYLRRVRRRFAVPRDVEWPENLHPVKILGTDYVFGQSDSTHGALWVVGREPALFDYFLPERWRRTPRTRLSKTNQTYHTLTKDDVNMVWKVSRVGEVPEVDPEDPRATELIAHGYNSPFEKFSIALELSRKGVPTVFPRAIYRVGPDASRNPDYVTDHSRFEASKHLLDMYGHPALRPDRLYITIYGYWQCPRVRDDGSVDYLCRPVNLQEARRLGLIVEEEMKHSLLRSKLNMAAAGFEDIVKPTHYLVSLTREGGLVRDEEGWPILRLCNFELVKGLHPSRASGAPAAP